MFTESQFPCGTSTLRFIWAMNVVRDLRWDLEELPQLWEEALVCVNQGI